MICLDSDCVIDYLNGRKEAVDIVGKYKEEIVATEITVFEVFYGIHARKDFSEEEEVIAEEFFNSIYVFPFDNGCGEKSAKILARLKKEGKLIEQNDCFIAAIVLNKGIDGIITRNKEHFSKIKGLKVIGY